MKQTIPIKDEFEGYSSILDDIRSLLNKAKLQAYKAVDNIRVQTYWQIGERIAREEFKYKDRAEYGKKVVERLTSDLKFSQAPLWRFVQFYKAYPILVTVSRELSWSHYEVLITIKNKEERRFYESYISANRCSVRELRKQLKLNLFKKYSMGKPLKLSPAATELQPQDIFKSAYNRLIICKSKDEETVHYALGDLKKEIFVSEYKLKLPSEKEIIAKLK